MDTFIEKIVVKRKDAKDYAIIAGVILAALIAIPLSFQVPVVNIFLAVGIAYGAYYLITSRNIEFEYIVTNGDLDIDRIISQRKRKRIFSASCKTFDIVAKVKSNSHSLSVQSIPKKIIAVSSLDSENAYFATLQYNNERTVVYFEPDERMLNNFRTFIPRKIESGKTGPG